MQQAHGFGKSGAESYHLEDFSTFSRKKQFRFFIFCNFEKTKMVFARFGFSWNFRLSYPRLRQALSRCGEIRSAPFATSVRRITSADVARRYANFAHL